MEKKFICLSGDYGVGKTTIANFLVEKIQSSKRLALGDMVREQLFVDLQPFIPYKEILYQKPTPSSVRDLIKGYAECKKVFTQNKYIWIQQLLNLSNGTESKIIIIDDMRFSYDYYYLQSVVGKENILLIYLGEQKEMYDLSFFYIASHIRLPPRNKNRVLEYAQQWLKYDRPL